VSVSFLKTVCRCDESCRTLKSIAAFSEQRAKRSTIERTRKKQRDADEIKRWERELKMGYEHVSVVATPVI
jgi:arsenate reductase-like glutaredoxin family protein